MKDRIARSVFWIVWSRGVVQAISFMSTLLVARLLSPSDYGLMAVAGACTSTVLLLTELGLGAAIVQFPDLRDEELNACFWFSLTAATGAYGGLLWASPWLAMWFAMPSLTPILRVAGLVFPLAALRLVPEGLLRKRLELDKVAKTEILSTLLGLPLVIGLAVAGAGVWALVGVAVSTVLIQTIAMFWFVRWWPGVRVRSTRLGEVVHFSAATMGTRLCAAAYQQADAVVLGKMAGDVSLGFFSMAKQLALLPAEKVSGVVNQVALPVMAELQADRVAMRTSFLRAIRLVASIAAPLSVGAALLAEDLVWLLLTEKWLPSVPLLRILCVYAVIRSCDVLFPPVLMARYRVRFLFWYAAMLLVVMPVMFVGGAVSMGATGVALAWSLVYPAVMVVMAREALSEVCVYWGTIWEQVRAPVAVALIMGGVIFAILWLLPAVDFKERALRVTFAALAGLLCYGAGIFWRGGPLANEITEMVGWLVGRPSTTAAK